MKFRVSKGKERKGRVLCSTTLYTMYTESGESDCGNGESREVQACTRHLAAGVVHLFPTRTTHAAD